MPRRMPREMSNEEFDEWQAATKRHEDIPATADEEGGPRLSLVPVTDRAEVWPTDLLPPVARPTPDRGGDQAARRAPLSADRRS